MTNVERILGNRSDSYPLARWTNAAFVRRCLVAKGLQLVSVDALSIAFLRTARALINYGCPGDAPSEAFFVPGRIEVLGKHTDYAGGKSIVCAVQRGFCFIAVQSLNRNFVVLDAETGEHLHLITNGNIVGQGLRWSTYPQTVVRRATKNFGPDLRGGVVAFYSNLEGAAGMSSSSAFITGLFLSLSAINALDEHPAYRANIADREGLAHYLGAMEGGRLFRDLAGDAGVGTSGGSEDHAAILCSKPGVLRCFSYLPVHLEATMSMPFGYVFVVATSGVKARKTGAARNRYNRAAHIAAHVAAVWREATTSHATTMGEMVRDPAFSPERVREILRKNNDASFASEDCLDRFEHFYYENERVLPGAVSALKCEDLNSFGRWVEESQEGAERLLKNQEPETAFLARSACENGAVAASAFGAGFGGAVWAMISEDGAAGFLEAWRTAYTGAFPRRRRRAKFFVEKPGPAAFRLGTH